jgi:NADH dehydrogenase
VTNARGTTESSRRRRRTRVLVNWALNATAGDDFVRTGFQQGRPATLQDFEHTSGYLTPAQLLQQAEGIDPTD